MVRKKIYHVEYHNSSKDDNIFLVEVSLESLKRQLNSMDKAIECINKVENVAPNLSEQVLCTCSEIIVKANKLKEIVNK